MALTPGLVLADRYRLTARIAVGGMGEVWEADDTRLARKVAVKILRSELTSDPEFVDRFRSEARITAALNHSGIAAVYDYGEVASIAGGSRDTAYLVMELVSGEPLSAVLARGRLSVPRTLDLLEQSGKALQVPHARALVHRDIKPGNILITPGGQVKITDFGIAKVAHQVPVTRGGMVMGTAQYLSPEQAAGHEAMPASDIYALGVVAFECLAGARPFNGDNPVSVAMSQIHEPPPPLPPDVPPAAAALVMRMLAKDPNRRFPDGGSLAKAVAGIRSPSRGVLGPVGPRSATAMLPRAQPMGYPARVTGAGGLTYAPQPSLPSAPVGRLAMGSPLPGRPVNRHTGIAVFIAIAALLIAAAAAIIMIQRAGTSLTGGLGPPAVAKVTGGDRATGRGVDTSWLGWGESTLRTRSGWDNSTQSDTGWSALPAITTDTGTGRR